MTASTKRLAFAFFVVFGVTQLPVSSAFGGGGKGGHQQCQHCGCHGHPPYSQKGASQKGPSDRPHEHRHFIGPPPPAIGIFESVAIRRVRPPQSNVTFRATQESGAPPQPQPQPQGDPESGGVGSQQKPGGGGGNGGGGNVRSADVDRLNRKLQSLEVKVEKLYKSLDLLVNQLTEGDSD